MKLPSYSDYWSNTLRYPPIADNMPRSRYKLLRQNLHFVDNPTYTEESGKLFKTAPVIEAIRKQCIIIEPEHFHTIDEQIIPSKTKFTKIRQYNPKKPCKRGFKNMVRAGSSRFMYDFYLYAGKEQIIPTEYAHLSASGQSVARLYLELPRHTQKIVFFDNWFSTLDLIHYLKSVGIHAVSTIRQNQLHGCPLISPKNLSKQERGVSWLPCWQNSGIVLVKWLNKSIVYLVSNCISVELVGTIDRWCNKSKVVKAVPWPKIVSTYNKSMGGVDLADILIALYRIDVKTCRWYIKVCQNYCRMLCSKCNVYFCLIANRNCYVDFHSKQDWFMDIFIL